jgi:ABC-2 type transport system permease protein
MVMANKYGDHKLRKFLTYELDRYLRGRSSEILEEMPLMRAENQPYIHYRKGSVIMMALKDRLGEQRLNQALKSLLAAYKFESDPYPTTLDLIARLNEVATDEEQNFISDQFAQISLYDLKATKAEVTMDDQGEHDITFTVSAKRFIANGQGEETEAPLDEYIDVVLFSADPEDITAKDSVLYKQKHQIKAGENVIEIHIPQLPEYAGIDPFVTLVDRDSADNIIRL